MDSIILLKIKLWLSNYYSIFDILYVIKKTKLALFIKTHLSMFNQLKKAIRNRKLSFTIKYSIKNINVLYFLLANKVITSFILYKQNLLIVTVNYGFDFSSPIEDIIINSNKLSNEQNKIINTFYANSNFTFNVHLSKKNVYTIDGLKKKPNYSVKFR